MTTPNHSFGEISVYLHIPFCQVRCSYCDFNTYAGLEDLMPAYARALAREIYPTPLSSPMEEHRRRGAGGGVVHTIYFGGGTPSLMPLPLLDGILAALRDTFDLTPDCEISLEANPGTVDLPYLQGLRALGVNRLSFGVQSAHLAELRLLDRLHTFEQAAGAVGMARAAGFDSRSKGLNLDLIFGIPHQTLAMWQETLARTLALEPEHLSLYALSLEAGTPMRARVTRGLLPDPDPDLAADMYEWASETLEARGFVPYEISNWAKDKAEESGKKERVDAGVLPPSSSFLPPDHACRHNLQYWRNLPYLGFGAGAHGYAGGWRYANVRSPREYVARIEQMEAGDFPFSPALAEKELVDREREMGETMMMGMRLVREGVGEREFRERFRIGLAEKYGNELGELEELGLIEWNAERVRLTRRGRLLANRVFSVFM